LKSPSPRLDALSFLRGFDIGGIIPGIGGIGIDEINDLEVKLGMFIPSSPKVDALNRPAPLPFPPPASSCAGLKPPSERVLGFTTAPPLPAGCERGSEAAGDEEDEDPETIRVYSDRLLLGTALPDFASVDVEVGAEDGRIGVMWADFRIKIASRVAVLTAAMPGDTRDPAMDCSKRASWSAEASCWVWD